MNAALKAGSVCVSLQFYHALFLFPGEFPK